MGYHGDFGGFVDTCCSLWDCRSINMKSTMYLYGIDPKELKLLTHYEATYSKIESGRKLYAEIATKLKKLSAGQTDGYEQVQGLNKHLKDVKKAIEFQQVLLGEME